MTNNDPTNDTQDLLLVELGCLETEGKRMTRDKLRCRTVLLWNANKGRCELHMRKRKLTQRERDLSRRARITIIQKGETYE